MTGQSRNRRIILLAAALAAVFFLIGPAAAYADDGQESGSPSESTEDPEAPEDPEDEDPPPNDHCDRAPDHIDYDYGKLFTNPCPSEPHVPSLREMIEAALGNVKGMKDEIGEKFSDAANTADGRAAEADRMATNAYASQKDSAVPGDPVLATTGRYILETADITVAGSGFEIRRTYISEGATTGSAGTGWQLSADSRIIRGSTEINGDVLREIEELVGEIQAAYEGIKSEYEEAVGKHDAQDSEHEGTDGEHEGTDNEHEGADNEHEGADGEGERLLSEAEQAAAIIGEIYDMYQAALAELEALRAANALGAALSALNRRALFPGTPEYYEGVGNERLVLVDGNGAPQTYEPAGRGVWVPTSYPERLYERIESRDGRGAETRAGFIYYGRGGITREYDGDGLLTKITELDGNSIEILRDERGHITRMEGPHGAAWDFTYAGNLITRIQGPEGEELRYGYSGNELSWAQDAEGDLARYAYESGRLKEIMKPDGSSIRLEYGLAGAGGAQLVTATTHEEGASEKFEYYPGQRTTVYTNHSGVITQYRYDDQHRTIEELHGSGLVKTYEYNDKGQLARERINGFEIRYGYDVRGNISERAYGDGTRERLEYNGKDQLTRYTDRDGTVTEWTYDSRGNCVEMRRGGVQIFAGTYDEKNRLVASREGERAEARYWYDSRDFAISRSTTINGAEIREYWEYDGLGRVTKYTDGAGREWKYRHAAKETVEETPTGLERRYITNNRKDLVQVIERDLATGEVREVNIEYDKRHLPVEARDGAGNITRYEYREDGELVRVEQGPWHWEYAYEAGGRISAVTRGKDGLDERYTEGYSYAWQAGGAQTRTITLPEAGSTAYGISPFGQITNITNALGETTTRTANGAGNTTREQAASGGYYEYRYDGLGRLAEAGREDGSGIQAQYNRDGSLAQKTDRLGNVTRYAYDGRGLLAREITALGEERYWYDLAGRLTRQETASRNTGTVYYTEWAYDDRARTVTITLGGAYTQTLYLNAWGEVIRVTDGEGNGLRYEYDGSGQLIKSIDGYGRETKYEWNEIGKIAKITYADNTSIEYEYDHLGNLTRITDALGISWAGEYDGAGRLKREQGRPGIDREYRYDVLGRIVEVKSGGEVIEAYRYTERGREVIFIDGQGNNFAQQKNGYGELAGETNRLNDRQSYAYDAEGRVVGITAYSGKETRVEYRDSEGLTITTYSDGSVSIIERDKAGNVIRISNETGTIRYRYDAGGRLIEQADEGAGEVTRYAYDRAGRRVRMASGNRDVRYEYGKNGELVRVTDNVQRLEARYEYDARGRETLRTYGNGVRQETAYDQIGRVILIKETDAMNRLLRAEAYVYDDKGRRSYSVDEEGKVTKYEYDNQSRLATVLYSWTHEKAEADRKEAEEAGLYFTADKGNGERYTIPPAEMGALRNALNRAAPLRGNAIVQSQMMWRETYTYDANGNRATKTTPWGTIEYEYDEENRLVRRGDIAYINDMDGNVLSERGLRYEAHYEYNGQNRMTYSEVTSHVDRTYAASFYAYDALGRRTLTESLTGQMLRTVYDGMGFEAIREGETFRNGSLTTQFATSEGTRAAQGGGTAGERYRWISEDYNGGSAVTEDGYTIEGSRYGTRGVTLYGNGEAVAVSYSSSTSSRSVYLGKDILGSVRTATTDGGAVEDRYEYDAFGQAYKGDLSGSMNLGYTGKPYDTATGLYNYGFRDYRPQAARFTTADPIRDGSNWYAYVNNDPVNWVDLWGLEGGILIFDATDRNDSLNNIRYHKYTRHDDYSEIRQAAAEQGLTVQVISGADARVANLERELANMNPDRVILFLHGEGGGYLEDITGTSFSIYSLTIPSNTTIIDNVSCYADTGPRSLTNSAGSTVEVRWYNPVSPSGELTWLQAADVLNIKIPESMRTGADTSNKSSSLLFLSNNIPLSDEEFAVGSSGANKGGINEKKNY